MNDTLKKKVAELLGGYPPEFNATLVEQLVLNAWRMGFDVVRSTDATQRYISAVADQCRALQNAFDPANDPASQSLANLPNGAKRGQR